MQRWIVAGVMALLAVVATWRYPLFRVVRVEPGAMPGGAAPFDAAAAAQRLWNEEIVPALATAPEASEVIGLLTSDPDAARRHFLIRGAGTIVRVERTRLGVLLGSAGPTPASEDVEPDLWLATGPIFGNAVRDSTGLTRGEDFINSQHFNGLAGALNLLVEAAVLPALRQVDQTGQSIRFAACMELPGGKAAVPLRCIPLQALID
ncbi:MAG TPA: DUF2291 family protein [Lacipirellulaceae bacterium]|nr:DUF2291 family protein [Lacipirellulaceae bacterium]